MQAVSIPPQDAHYTYWRSELTHELMGTADASYMRTLRDMLARLVLGEIVLPRRCQRCTHYFAQPATAGWRKFCSTFCRQRSPVR